MVKIKAGGNSNPADKQRKLARKRELKKQKEIRKQVREASLLYKDTFKLEKEIEKYKALEKEGLLDKNNRTKFKDAKEKLEFINKSRKEKGIQVKKRNEDLDDVAYDPMNPHGNVDYDSSDSSGSSSASGLDDQEISEPEEQENVEALGFPPMPTGTPPFTDQDLFIDEFWPPPPPGKPPQMFYQQPARMPPVHMPPPIFSQNQFIAQPPSSSFVDPGMPYPSVGAFPPIPPPPLPPHLAHNFPPQFGGMPPPPPPPPYPHMPPPHMPLHVPIPFNSIPHHHLPEQQFPFPQMDQQSLPRMNREPTHLPPRAQDKNEKLNNPISDDGNTLSAVESSKKGQVLAAEPQLRNLQKELVSLVPQRLLKKKMDESKKVAISAVPSVPRPIINAAPDIQLDESFKRHNAEPSVAPPISRLFTLANERETTLLSLENGPMRDLNSVGSSEVATSEPESPIKAGNKDDANRKKKSETDNSYNDFMNHISDYL